MPHYAISEFLIVIASLWGISVAYRVKNFWALLGFLCFCLIGIVAVSRFGFNRIDELAELHQTISKFGAFAAVYFFVAGFLMLDRDPLTPKLTFIAIIILMVLVTLLQVQIVPLFLVGTFMVSYAAFHFSKNVFWTLGAAIMLPNMFFVNQSPVLGPDISWHAFHTLIAVWLVILGLFFKRYHTGLSNEA